MPAWLYPRSRKIRFPASSSAFLVVSLLISGPTRSVAPTVLIPDLTGSLSESPPLFRQ